MLKIHIEEKQTKQKSPKEDEQQKEDDTQAQTETQTVETTQIPVQTQQIQSESQVAQPDSPSEDVTVYITSTGNKYHSAGCRFLKQSSIPKKLSEVRGTYVPCAVCHPPQ